MRAGLLGVAALVAGALGAHVLLQDPGYVLISAGAYVIEMSVPVLILVLIAAYALVRAGLKLARAPRALGAALADRRERRAAGRLERALIHLAEGDWRRGERLLTRASRATETPLVTHLMAARAAQLQGAPGRRDEWLAGAVSTAPEAEAAVLVTQAELQLGAGELEAARGTLERLCAARSDHALGLGLMARTLHALGDRAALVELLPKLGRAQLGDGERERLAAAALEHAFGVDDLTRARIDALWNALPAAMRGAPALLRRRALALERVGHGDDAEKALRAALNRRWSAELARAYGDVTGADRLKQLKQAEKWLEAHADDAALLFTAARLCLASELWGKARSYYESGLALAPEADAYASYGKLLEQLGERAHAARAFESGLELATGSARAVPALEGPARQA